MLALAPLVAYVPMASLAALMVLVAWNMAEVHNFVGIVRVAPKSDVLVLLTCFLLTVALRHGRRRVGRRSCSPRCCSCAGCPS